MKAYSASFIKGVKILNLIFVPCYVIYFILAEDIVKVLLGQKWTEIIEPIRILCLVMPLRSFEILFIPAMNGLGKSGIIMMTSGFTLVTMVCAFLVGLHWGYTGLCWAWVAGFTLVFTVIIGICLKNLQVDIAELAQTYKTPIVLSLGLLIMGVMLMGTDQNVMSPLLRITVFLIGSIILYGISIWYFEKPMIMNMKSMYEARKRA
jgi:O-antigen/teichoic acid export membrane protein